MLFVLYTSPGTRFALTRGTAYYAGLIPGDITLETTDGALASGVTITGLRIRDRDGRVLVASDHLKLGVDVGAALHRTIDVGTLELRGAEVAVDGAFGDLAPEGPSEPSPPTPNLGPDLPLELVGQIRIRDLELHDATQSLTRLHVLDVGLWAQGTQATVTLDAGAAVPIADLDVHTVALQARWDDPTVTLSSLAAQTTEGEVWISNAKADLSAMYFDLGTIVAHVETERAGPQLREADVELVGEGTLANMSVEALVAVPAQGELSLLAEGGLDDPPWADLLLDAGLVGADGLPPLTLAVDASGEGDLASGIDATVRARCEGCDDTLGPIDLRADARVGPAATLVRLDADMTAQSIEVHVDGMGSAAIGGGLGATVRIPRLSDFEPLVHRFAPDLELRGAVELDAGCGALMWPTIAVCRTWGGVDHGVPIDRVAFDLSAGIRGQRVAALVHGLEVDQGLARLRMDGGPAKVLYTPEEVSAKDVRARLGTTGGLGTVSVEGRLGLGDDPRVDAQVHVTNLGLQTLDPVAPQLHAGGKLSADAMLAGSLSDPNLELQVHGRGMKLMGIALGDLDLDARYAAHDLHAALDAAGGDLGKVELRGDIPVLVDANAGRFELESRQRAAVRLDVRGVRLDAVGKLVPDLSGLRGEVDLSLTHAGPIVAPRLDAEVALRDGSFDGRVLPEVGVRLHYARREADVEVIASHPEAFERLALTAKAPLALDLLRGSARLQPDPPIEADLTLTGANLAYARELDPKLETAGTVSVKGSLRGKPSAPEVEVTVEADRLAWQERSAGALSMKLGYRDHVATAQAWASSPELSGLGLDATVPVSLDLTQGTPQWHADRPHAVHVALVDVLVRPTMQWVPEAPPLDLDGRISAQVDLTGPATQPKIILHTEADDVVYGGRSVGHVDVDATYAKARADAEVLWTADSGHTAWARASAPMTLDLPSGAAAWDRNGRHEVRLSIPKLDPALVEPFVDVGEFDGAFAVNAIGSGNLDDFDASLSARGNLRGRGASLPVDARVVVGPKQQQVSVDLGSQSKVRVRTEADVPSIARGGDWKQSPLEATADIDALRLSTLAPFLPSEVQGPRGSLDTHVKAGGRLGKPTFEGSLALSDGAVTVVPARVRLTGISAASTFSQNGLTLDHLTFDAGEGKVKLEGNAVVEENTGVRSKVRLDAKEFPLRAPGLPRMALSTAVDADMFLTLDETRIDLLIHQTLVDVYATSISAADPIPTNDNVVLADLSRPGDPIEKKPEVSEPSPKDISIRFKDDIRVVGPSIDMRWGGALETKTSASGTSTSGKLEAGRGSFDLLGNEFDLETGTVYLAEDGSGMPFIDVVANTTVEDVVITVTVRGPASHPDFELTSVPPLPQSEIFTILVTGTTDTQGADSDEVQDKAAAVLAAMSNGALQRQLDEALHVDKIGIGFGDSTDQPILSVGKNITRNVYAETEYHHNAPQNVNRAQLEVQYEFAPRWSLETFFGDAAQGGISVFWGLSFDTKTNVSDER